MDEGNVVETAKNVSQRLFRALEGFGWALIADRFFVKTPVPAEAAAPTEAAGAPAELKKEFIDEATLLEAETDLAAKLAEDEMPADKIEARLKAVADFFANPAKSSRRAGIIFCKSLVVVAKEKRADFLSRFASADDDTKRALVGQISREYPPIEWLQRHVVEPSGRWDQTLQTGISDDLARKIGAFTSKLRFCERWQFMLAVGNIESLAERQRILRIVARLRTHRERRNWAVIHAFISPGLITATIDKLEKVWELGVDLARDTDRAAGRLARNIRRFRRKSARRRQLPLGFFWRIVYEVIGYDRRLSEAWRNRK